MTKKEILLSYLQNKRFVRTSLLFWLVIYALVMLIQYAGGREGDYETLIRISAITPVVVLVFYFNFFLCEFFFVKNRVLFFLVNIILLIVFAVVTQVVSGSINTVLVASIYYMILVLVSVLYWSVTYASKKDKEALGIQLRLQAMENEKVIAEKHFLQSQINPHFLYNTLNFFYAKSLTLSPELAESILLLSGIMRYSLDQKENSTGMVLLDDEIEHINNVKKINQFRFNNKLQAQFLISGDTKHARIIPLVLITLVENAFKHGELLNSDFPVVITLTVNENNKTIDFVVKNKKKTGPKEMGTGIGLENTRRRLAFIYNGAERLELKDEEEFYTAILQLPLFKAA